MTSTYLPKLGVWLVLERMRGVSHMLWSIFLGKLPPFFYIYSIPKQVSIILEGGELCFT
jgi:hypothetical protein